MFVACCLWRRDSQIEVRGGSGRRMGEEEEKEKEEEKEEKEEEKEKEEEELGKEAAAQRRPSPGGI